MASERWVGLVPGREGTVKGHLCRRHLIAAVRWVEALTAPVVVGLGSGHRHLHEDVGALVQRCSTTNGTNAILSPKLALGQGELGHILPTRPVSPGSGRCQSPATGRSRSRVRRPPPESTLADLDVTLPRVLDHSPPAGPVVPTKPVDRNSVASGGAGADVELELPAGLHAGPRRISLDRSGRLAATPPAVIPRQEVLDDGWGIAFGSPGSESCPGLPSAAGADPAAMSTPR